MACINVYSAGGQDHHQSAAAAAAARISFSNDFVVEPPSLGPKQQQQHNAPADPDFEFTVGSRPMMAADELFFKGRLLPIRPRPVTTTLRDELRAGEDEDDRVPVRSGGSRWKELLGLRKGGAGKKHDKGDTGAASACEDSSKSSQEMRSDGGLS